MTEQQKEILVKIGKLRAREYVLIAAIKEKTPITTNENIGRLEKLVIEREIIMEEIWDLRTEYQKLKRQGN